MYKLFFGLLPPPQQQTELYRLNGLINIAGGLRIRKENLHLTLHFLGQVEQLDCLLEQASQCRQSAFDVTLSRWGWFRKPMILWYGPVENNLELLRLAGFCADLSANCGYPGDVKAYRPHVSIQRNIANQPDIPTAGSIRWQVDEFHLFTSQRTAEGVSYHSLQRIPLEPASAGPHNT